VGLDLLTIYLKGGDKYYILKFPFIILFIFFFIFYNFIFKYYGQIKHAERPTDPKKFNSSGHTEKKLFGWLCSTNTSKYLHEFDAKKL
jgi:hypothetical protein